MYIVIWQRGLEYRRETLSHFWEAVAHGAQLADIYGGEFVVRHKIHDTIVFDSTKFDGLTPINK